MRDEGYVDPETVPPVKNGTLNEIKEINTAILSEIISQHKGLYSKNDYAFGVYFIYLYYIQKILSNVGLPDGKNLPLNKGNDQSLFYQPGTQEQIVTFLAGSRDRSGLREAVLPVWLKPSANFSLEKELNVWRVNPTISFIAKKILESGTENPSKQSSLL